VTANDLLTVIGIVLGVIAGIGIAVTLWAACALSGQVDENNMAKKATAQLLTWARQEFDRQMAEDAHAAQICHRCHRHASEAGYARWSRCNHCDQPICDRCAVQSADGHFCPDCPPELPF
jgi:uncharacterized CHY-type Zn-finger protein